MHTQPITHGLIGKKLGHSFSKKYFTKKFDRENIAAAYNLFEIQSIEEFPALWEDNPRLMGLNVTIPYKQEVMAYLDKVMPEAAEIGAVNTIKRTSEGLLGYNSDLWGFHDDLKDFLQEGAKVEGAMILGTGGAARAVAYALKKLFKVEDVICLSRKGGREFMGFPVENYGKAEGLPQKYWQLVINTTPLGMYPKMDEAPEIPYEKFQAGHGYAYDLVYNPAETSFMKLAQQNGAFVRNGMGMLIGQAENAWEFWTKTD